MIEVKICGINDEENLKACIKFGADYIGFVFWNNSKRNIKINDANYRIIKAIGISTKKDLFQLNEYQSVCDILLLDYKASNSLIPGGSGKSFDWSILKNFNIKTPWMLAGGLKPENINNAINITKAKKVDVSSGVEENGLKSFKKIKSFLLNAKGIKK